MQYLQVKRMAIATGDIGISDFETDEDTIGGERCENRFGYRQHPLMPIPI